MAIPRDPDFLFRHVEQYYQTRVRDSWNGGHILRGREPRPDDIVLTSNDYLNVADDPRIIAAEIESLVRLGHGIPQSRVFRNHVADGHRAFERRMAAVLGAEDAVLCQSGYDANLGVVEAFANSSFSAYIDMRAHASLWKGCISAGIRPIPFHHNDYDHLAKQIAKGGSGLVIVDAVYSTDGSLCPLHSIVSVAQANECAIIVDETHSFGVQGAQGEGLTKSLGLERDVHFQVVGLSKAFASRGGIVAGAKRNMDFFRDNSYPAIFSTQVMAHEVAGYEAALEIIQSEPHRRQTLHAGHREFRLRLDEIGYNVDDSETQIVAIESGTEKDTIRFRDFLEERGLFGSVFCWPATSKSRSLLRFSMSSAVHRGQINRAVDVLADAYSTLQASDWKSTRKKKGIAGQ